MDTLRLRHSQQRKHDLCARVWVLFRTEFLAPWQFDVTREIDSL